MRKQILTVFCLAILFMIRIPVNAHPGKTDANGGHTDHSTGEYHYHHGEEAHQHFDIDGNGSLDCPLTFDGGPDHNLNPAMGIAAAVCVVGTTIAGAASLSKNKV